MRCLLVIRPSELKRRTILGNGSRFASVKVVETRDRRTTYTITEISCPVLERCELYIIILNKTFKVSKKGNTHVTTLTVHVFQRGFP